MLQALEVIIKKMVYGYMYVRFCVPAFSLFHTFPAAIYCKVENVMIHCHIAYQLRLILGFTIQTIQVKSQVTLNHLNFTAVRKSHILLEMFNAFLPFVH